MAFTSTGIRYDLIARDSASRTFKKVGDSAARLDGGLGKLGKTVAYAGAALAGALAAGFVVSAKKAIDFQTEMTKVQTQAGASAKDVAVLSKGVLELGKTTQQGPQKLAEAMYHLKSVGMDNASALKSLKVASDLAAVGGSELEDTTNALAGAWRSGIKGAETFSKAAGTVNAVIGAGNMRMEDFVEAIGTGILPSAKSFGLSLNQVGAALALMTDEGVPAVDAATRLRMSFSLLGAPSAAADKQLEKIGLTGLDLAKAMRGPQGLIGAVSLLKDHLDKSGLSAAQASQLLSRAFGGGKSDSAILTMLNNLDVLKLKQDQVNKSTSKFGPAVTAQRKTVSAQLALIESNLQVMAIDAGTKLLPPITNFVTFLTKTAIPAAGHLTTTLKHLVPLDQIKSDFGTATQWLTDFFKGLNPKKPPIIPVQPKLQFPKSVPPDLVKYGLPVPTITPKIVLPKNLPPAAIEYGITLHPIVPAPSEAQKQGAQLRKLLSGSIDDALKSIPWGQLGAQLGKGLGTAFGWVTAHSAELTKKLATAIGSVDWADVGKSLGSLALPLAIGFVDHLFDPLFTVSFWEKHWLDTILAVISVLPISKVIGAAGKLLGKIPWGKVGDVMDHLPWGRIFHWSDWITKPIGGALGAAGRFVGRLADGFVQGFRQKFPTIAKFFYEQMILLPVRVGDLGRLMKAKAAGLVTSFGKKLLELLPKWMRTPVKIAAKYLGRFTFWQTGIQLVQGLLNGIGNGLVGIGKWINAHVVRPVVDWTKSLFGVHSPSTVFAAIGRDLIRGLLGGVLVAISGVGKWLHAHVISPITGAFAGAGSWLHGRGGSIVTGLKAGILSGAAGVGKWMTGHVVSPIKGAFTGAGTWLYRAGLDVMSGLLSGLKQGFKSVSGLLSKISGAVKNTVSSAVSGLSGVVGKIPGLASGGFAPIGQVAWVGESGPELMQVTRTGTRIIPSGQSKALASTLGVAVPSHFGGAAPARVRVPVWHGGGRPPVPQHAIQQGGQFTGELYLDSGAFLGIVQGTVEPLVREGVARGHADLAAALQAGGA